MVISKLLAATAFVGAVQAVFPDCANGPLASNPICNSTLDARARVQGLLSVLTAAEKINQTISTAPGVPRLGLPPYTWWNEGLHGVASSPGVTFAPNGSDFSYATSFPQPILMGAAFDDDLIQRVASVVSTEARAFNNANRSGLDFWTPNINPFKDPRWGRGQETPGEDPFHLSSYVKALISGLEGTTGDDPSTLSAEGTQGKYKKIVATCKHFVGYDMESWDGNYRYQWDAPISQQDLVEYYTPPFQACTRDANVGAVMCSYNAVNGVPTCADPWLLETVLRDHWKWGTNATTGQDEHWVTSDCDAVQNVFLPHRYAPTREAAAALSLKAGTDVNCGTYYQTHLPAALAQGLINETDLDTALVRQYSSLIRLGYFDPPAQQPLRSEQFSSVNTPNAQHLAYQAAAEGITLLYNPKQALPLTNLASSNLTVALIGDWANATTQMQGNYEGVAPYLHSPLYAAQQLLGKNRVLYANGAGFGNPTTDSFAPIWKAAAAADIIIYASGIDNSVESEGMDRTTLSWTGNQLDIFGQLAQYGKPLVVLQMGGGQVDSTPIISNPNTSALIWGGYPGQDGGIALLDVITGKVAPAGRLPITQYPATYIDAVPMTDMSLRPGATSPGRTYRWYNGTAVFPFGYGLHYTSFTGNMSLTNEASPSSSNRSYDMSYVMSYDISSLTSSCTAQYKDLCPFATASVQITNTGSLTSDYVALLFLNGTFGPTPYPIKTLVSYGRAHNVTCSSTANLSLNLTLGSLSRVDDMGNRVLYPGSYGLVLDTNPGLATLEFELTGSEVVLDKWPQPPANRSAPLGYTNEVAGDYYQGGYGSTPSADLDQRPM